MYVCMTDIIIIIIIIIIMNKDNYITEDQVSEVGTPNMAVIEDTNFEIAVDDEVVSGVTVKNDYNHPYVPNRLFCGNCKKAIHNTPDNDTRCRRKGCECKCQTHYVGYDGRIRPYGTIDDSHPDNRKPNEYLKYDSTVDKLNEEWRQIHAQR